MSDDKILDEVRSSIRRKFVEYTGLTEEQLFGPESTLATVMAQSPKMTNSIDLMEAFAKTANSLRKEYGVRVQLPSVPLETPTDDVLDAYLAAFADARSEVSA